MPTKTNNNKKRNGKAKGRFNLHRQNLLAAKQEVLNLYNTDLRDAQVSDDQGGEDLVDRANNAYNRELLFSLSGGERQALRDIQEALERIEAGTYGVCEPCGSEIGEARLKAIPWARYCIDCQERYEQGLVFDEG